MNREDLKDELKKLGHPSAKSFAKTKSSVLKDIIETHTSFLDEINPKFSYRLMCIMNDMCEFPKCPYCGNDIKYFDKVKSDKLPYSNVKFRKYCSRKCTVASGQFKDNVRKTSLLRFGVENAMQNDAIKDKVRSTNLNNHGVNWFTQTLVFKEKSINSWKENCGNDIINPSQAEEVKEKKRISSLDKYGVENVAQSKEVQEKTIKTCIEKYGVSSVFSSKEIKQKIKDKNIEKYGVDNVMKCPLIIQKANNTHFERRGGWPLQCKEVRSKINNKSLEQYGVIWPVMSDEVKESIRNAQYAKFGSYYVETDDFKEKYKITSTNNWGTEHPMQNSSFFDNFVKISQKSTKEYTMPSGKIITLQGYEPNAMDILLKFYNEDDFVFGSDIKPWVWYELNNKKKRYFPDIYIKSENLLIEVKSEYTITQNKELNKLKESASINCGFNFIFMVI